MVDPDSNDRGHVEPVGAVHVCGGTYLPAVERDHCNRVETVENQVGVFAPFWLVNEFELVFPH